MDSGGSVRAWRLYTRYRLHLFGRDCCILCVGRTIATRRHTSKRIHFECHRAKHADEWSRCPEFQLERMISVIIPTLNEAVNLPRCAAALRAHSGACELIVVDGGSSDCTCEVANNLGAQVIKSAGPQRAAQMNLGARAAS